MTQAGQDCWVESAGIKLPRTLSMMLLLICVPTAAVAFFLAYLLGPAKAFAAIAFALMALLAVMYAKRGAEAFLIAAYGGFFLLPIIFGFLLGNQFRPKKKK
jgi:uncharacterized membrane protein YphA (DoxX/SURF4 family)